MRKWLPLTAVCLGTFMLLIDVTIVNVALPDMATDLKAPFASLQWVMDIYALVLAALLLAAGSVADNLGRRRVYLAGLVIFGVSSLACGVAKDDAVLILARGVQGVGAAAMFATTIALLNASYHGRDRGIAYGIWGAVSGAAAATGPIVGGLLTQSLSWRWIFFVNLPICLAAITLTLLALEGGRGDHRERLDLPGMVLFTASASALTYAFIRAGSAGWGEKWTLTLIVAGLVALAVFVAVELALAHPLMDLRLFSDRRFAGAMLVALAFPLSAFSYLSYASIWLQSVRDLSPIEAGCVFLPMSGFAFTVSAAIGRHLHGRDPRWIISAGMLFVGVGGLAQAVQGADSSWPSLLVGLFLTGVGVGLVGPTLAAAVMGAVPLRRSGMAAGAMNTSRQLGFAFGIAVLGTIFRSRIESSLSGAGVPSAQGVAEAVSGGQTRAVLAQVPAAGRGHAEHVINLAFASGLNTIFVVSGGIGLVVGLLTMLLLRPVVAAEASSSATPNPEAAPTH